MSANKYEPHVHILPEDDANRQIAVGFALHVPLESERKLQRLEPAGGWIKVLDKFESDLLQGMHKYPERLTILLIDFDQDQNRLSQARSRVPPSLADRVFIIGVWSEPERLRADLETTYESIGGALATDCRDNADSTWNHPLLRHNAEELTRMRSRVRPILFP